MTTHNQELQLSQPARAAQIAKSLREVARRVQRSKVAFIPTGSANGRRGDHLLKPAIFLGLLLIVVMPTLITAAYLWLVASDQYAVETRFAVRGGERAALQAGLAGAAIAQRIQDSLIVYDYIHSRGIVEELDKTINLRSRYSRPEADVLWRFNANRPIEDLVEYWRRRVDVQIDHLSGVITVLVRAFTPADALEIAKGVVASSERLVNDLSDRSRRDALQQAQTELAQAQANLQKRIREMRDLRNSERLLDPKQSAEELSKIHTDLRLELIKLEQDYAVQRRSVSTSMPHLRVTEARINSLKEQLSAISAQMTNSAARIQGPALADTMGKFERQKLDHTLAEQQYQNAANALERARLELASQHIYLASYVQPTPAEEALYPQRAWILSAVFFVALAVWGLAVGLAVLVRNHMAI